VHHRGNANDAHNEVLVLDCTSVVNEMHCTCLKEMPPHVPQDASKGSADILDLLSVCEFVLHLCGTLSVVRNINITSL